MKKMWGERNKDTWNTINTATQCQLQINCETKMAPYAHKKEVRINVYQHDSLCSRTGWLNRKRKTNPQRAPWLTKHCALPL